jgi:hypothetical protein
MAADEITNRIALKVMGEKYRYITFMTAKLKPQITTTVISRKSTM